MTSTIFSPSPLAAIFSQHGSYSKRSMSLCIASSSSSTEALLPPPLSSLSPSPSQSVNMESLNKYSSRITGPKSQGGSQTILYGVGSSDDDMSKPQIGTSSVWYEGNKCNMHLLGLAEAVKEGVREAGMVGFRFNTNGVSDAISMGTRGMCFSLEFRDLIGDTVNVHS